MRYYSEYLVYGADYFKSLLVIILDYIEQFLIFSLYNEVTMSHQNQLQFIALRCHIELIHLWMILSLWIRKHVDSDYEIVIRLITDLIYQFHQERTQMIPQLK